MIFSAACPRGEALTFLLVEGGQDAVVPAHLEVNLLLHTLGDGALRDDDADTGLYRAQDPSITVEDAPGSSHHRVPFVFIVIVQCTRAIGQGYRQSSVRAVQAESNVQRTQKPLRAGSGCILFRPLKLEQCGYLTLRGWPWGWR